MNILSTKDKHRIYKTFDHILCHLTGVEMMTVTDENTDEEMTHLIEAAKNNLINARGLFSERIGN